jgi:hypothetical protein
MKAKRGDLAAIVSTSRTYVIGEASTERTQVTLGIVSSITREGLIKAVRPVWSGEGPSETSTPLRPHETALAIPADGIDVEAAIQAYAARRYETAPHSTMVPPASSVEEMRALLAPFRRVAA